jgi:probable phosphoglycerate mutase
MAAAKDGVIAASPNSAAPLPLDRRFLLAAMRKSLAACDAAPSGLGLSDCAVAVAVDVKRLFVLARHGESTLNVDGIVNGDPSREVHLTQRGRDEALLLGHQLRNVSLDLCLVTRFGRTRETAGLALAARSVRFDVEPLFDDVDIGDLEGSSLEDYRTWKREHTRADPFPSGESLDAAAVRYSHAFRSLLDRVEPTILVVSHEIPVRYALNAAEGSPDLDSPHRKIANATPYLFDERRLAEAAAQLATTGRGT